MVNKNRSSIKIVVSNESVTSVAPYKMIHGYYSGNRKQLKKGCLDLRIFKSGLLRPCDFSKSAFIGSM